MSQKRICEWCNGTGIFNDFDTDCSYGLPICYGCGGLGMYLHSGNRFYPTHPDFAEVIKQVGDFRKAYCPHHKHLPDSPEILKIRALESLIEAVKEVYRKYGPGTKGCYGKRIADGILSPLIEIHRRRQAEDRQSLKVAELHLEECRPILLMATDGDIEEADKRFAEVVADHPFDSIVAFDYAQFILTFRQNRKDAMPWLIKATQLEPRKAQHFLELARNLEFRRPGQARAKLLDAMHCPDAGSNREIQEILSQVRPEEGAPIN